MVTCIGVTILFWSYFAGMEVMLYCSFVCFFFFKQKTAYEMRISDWSSDVCSSDLQGFEDEGVAVARACGGRGLDHRIFARHLIGVDRHREIVLHRATSCRPARSSKVGSDRKSVV